MVANDWIDKPGDERPSSLRPKDRLDEMRLKVDSPSLSGGQTVASNSNIPQVKIDASGASMEYSDGKGRTMNGSPTFYALLDKMARIHDIKSHDYASNSNPFGNYRFAGQLSKLFDNPDDAGFLSRIGEKLYRLANLENSGKLAKNETIHETEIDICTIMALWMASRIDRRAEEYKSDRIR